MDEQSPLHTKTVSIAMPPDVTQPIFDLLDFIG